ncbi:hypothetical protein Hanom_Chr12g01070721 [Helianthus anomalus]
MFVIMATRWTLLSLESWIQITQMFEVPAVAYSAEVANSAYIQVNSLLEMGNNPIDAMLRRSIGGPVSIPETFVVSSCFNQMQPGVTWDDDLHNLYRMEIQQESSTIPFQPHKFTGKKSINLYTYFFQYICMSNVCYVL